nr:MAG: replication associated protein [Cressdnaviricota sp.]
MTSRSRAFCFTINNYTFDDMEILLGVVPVYLCFGFEVGGKKNVPHIQGYVYFEDAKTIKSIKKYFPRAKLIPCKGSTEQNVTYCSKEEDFYEFGEKPTPGRAKWDLIEKAMKDPRENIQIYMQYRKAYREIISNEVDLEKRRFLFALDSKEKWTEAKRIRNEGYTVCIWPSEYDGEDVYFVPCYDIGNVLAWINGFPPTSYLGYEKKIFDPDTIYIMYQDLQEWNHIQKTYKDFIDFSF